MNVCKAVAVLGMLVGVLCLVPFHLWLFGVPQEGYTGLHGIIGVSTGAIWISAGCALYAGADL